MCGGASAEIWLPAIVGNAVNKPQHVWEGIGRRVMSTCAPGGGSLFHKVFAGAIARAHPVSLAIMMICVLCRRVEDSAELPIHS